MLSYTWGDPSDTTSLVLDDDHDFMVTTNLKRAPPDLRLEDEVRTILVDAVCINQKNVAERSHQVSIMRTIYSNASVVDVWLDLEIDMQTPAFTKLSTRGSTSSGDAADGLGDDPDFWKPLEPLFSQRYWKRLWVQHELFHASDFVIHCRRGLLPGKCIVACHEELRTRRALERYWVIVSEKISFRGSPLKHFQDWQLRVRRSDDLRSSSSEQVAYLPPPLNKSAISSFGSIYHRGSLLYCLASYRTLQVSDPKDKVSGILGLALDCSQTSISIDCDDSVAVVYVNAIRFLIAKYGTLDFLRFACVSEGRRHGDDGLLSWLRDRSVPSRVYSGMGYVRASASLIALQYPIFDDGLKLRVQRIRLDRIINDDPHYDIISESVQWMIDKLKLLHSLALSKQDLDLSQNPVAVTTTLRADEARGARKSSVDGNQKMASIPTDYWSDYW